MKTYILIIVLILSVLSTAVMADVPPLISYQGKLMQPNGTPIPDGTYSIRFAIYSVPADGDMLWSETISNVQVKGGLFAVLLGSVNNLGANILDSEARYLGIKVGNDDELIPRQRIASVATSLRAGEADIAKTVPDGAITANKIIDSAIVSSKLADGGVTASKIADGAINAVKIASASMGNAQIADGAAIQSTKLDMSPSIFWNGVGQSSPKIAAGVFYKTTVAGELLVYNLSYGTSFSELPTVIVTPGNGSHFTSSCSISVQYAGRTGAEVWITDTVSNSGHRAFHWIAIGH